MMTRHGDCRRKPLVLLSLGAALACFATPAFGQSSVAAHQPAVAGAFSYEAVTIKPADAGSSFWRYTPDGFTTGGMPAENLIRTAFGLIMSDQIVGLPGWARSEPLAIQAKMDAETASALDKLSLMQRWNQTRDMMQALLADRFALKVHHETRDLPIYVLTVAKGGSRMKKTSADSGGGNAVYASGKIEAHSIPMDVLAMNLSSTVGRLIVNKTGLEGGYDFTLEYAAEGADPTDSHPSIFTAFEEQLGLKLEPARGPVDVIVIDHIERPTAN
jgi:uncharacterized protein (TIGR03435 family)